MAVTIHDVARLAGVSVATVSRALNGSVAVVPSTRQRVEEAALALRFVPSPAARSLIRRRTDTIGALLPDLHGEYFSELIRGIDQAARARGQHLLLSSSHGDACEAALALRAMQGRVDGLLVMSPHLGVGDLERDLPPALPVVLISHGGTGAGQRHRRFAVDNETGVRAAAAHLLGLGHRRIAFVSGPAENAEAAERLRVLRTVLRGARAPAPVVIDGDFSQESGHRAGQRVAAMRPRPEAVFAANDMMALGCLAALADAGVAVPDDIAVVGFDDVPIARYVTPSLTTVRVPIAALGAAALGALVDAVAGDAAGAARGIEATTLMPVELVVRRSCGAARPRRRGEPKKPVTTTQETT